MKRKILLIGANGQLGSDLKKALSHHQLLCPSHQQLDITQFAKTKKYIKEKSPDLIIDTAAFHQIDECEKNPRKTFLVNTLAVKNLAEVAKKMDIPLVYISSDYVFGLDQRKKIPYLEKDLPGPVNIYGISKVASEYIIRYILKKYFIVRTQALFGETPPRGKKENFVGVMLRLAKEGKEIRVKDDEFTSPTYTKELAGAISDLIQTEEYGLYHIASQGGCSWYEFAKEIFKQTHKKANLKRASSLEFPGIAQRPRYSVLENKHLREIGLDKMSHWQKALKKYLKQIII